MVFSSNFFLLKFLPVFLIAFFLAPKKYRNLVTLIASLFFYIWGAPKFIFILLASLYVDFFLVRLIYTAPTRASRLYLTISVVLNIAMLGFFKYSNFFVDNWNSLLLSSGRDMISWEKVALPIGISFITFHKLTYAIDAFRKVHSPLQHFSDYLLYILMFPHQIAGPIVRYNEIADQLEDKERRVTADFRFTGMVRFIEGLGKKVIIANPLGIVADQVFALDISDTSSGVLWLGILAYTFQIYFDFSGYSDMGIGLARIIGFTFPENFNFPYVSKSITEFWRRWHITLGRFMRDYLYIPLGGNRVGKIRLLFNLWFVFLISGLWHGASWTFIVWGAFHGLILILDRLFLLKFYEKIGGFLSLVITFLLTVIGWVFFRAETLPQAFTYIRRLFSFSQGYSTIEVSDRFIIVFSAAILISFFPLLSGFFAKKVSPTLTKVPVLTVSLKTAVLFIIAIWCIAEINSSGFNPFIYYRF